MFRINVFKMARHDMTYLYIVFLLPSLGIQHIHIDIFIIVEDQFKIELKEIIKSNKYISK